MSQNIFDFIFSIAKERFDSGRATRIPDVSFVLVGCAAPITSAAQIISQLIYYRYGSWRKLTLS